VHSFLTELLREGRAMLRERPRPVQHDAEALAVLRSAYADYRLTVAGPVIEFDLAVALAAASVAQHACWLLLSRDESPTEVERLLRLPQPAPWTAAAHLSADLVLRLLPRVHRRAAARDAADPLAVSLARLFREWPLSGVLADVDEAPTTGLDFAGHRGLQHLYAERWLTHEKPAWAPVGPGWEYVEWIGAELGRDLAGLRPDRTAGRHDDGA
jgi:hypothetical protein